MGINILKKLNEVRNVTNHIKEKFSAVLFFAQVCIIIKYVILLYYQC